MIGLLLLFILPTSFSFNVDGKSSRNSILTREEVLSKALAIAPVVIRPPVCRSFEDNFQSRNVLLDLPPQNPDAVRLYLCRHGQTENNRLHIVQGAHVDPPLNEIGRRMAARLGQEFAALDRTLSNRSISNHHILGFSKFIFHSKLQRSKETALIASDILNGSDFSFGASLLPMTAISPADKAVKLSLLDSLGEVDLGLNCEGRKETAIVRTDMYRTYADWALGKIDTTNKCSSSSNIHTIGEGETGRSVLQRAASSLTCLLQKAQEQNVGSIVAISHSAFLRTLLCISMDTPLLKAAILPQANGCINILDLYPTKKPKLIGSKSNLFIGGLGPSDFELEIPHLEVIRINEKRHLSGLL